MIKLLQSILLKYQEAVAYLFFGVLTTVLNQAVYLAWVHFDSGNFANVAATLFAWVASVLFAYFTNRKWVFKSDVTGIWPRIRECGSFFGSRAATGLLDLGIMYLTVDILHFNGGVMKLLSNVLVVILNYILSRLVIFKKSA